jgi:hypothetical protein
MNFMANRGECPQGKIIVFSMKTQAPGNAFGAQVRHPEGQSINPVCRS